jgi:hypothetical protein
MVMMSKTPSEEYLEQAKKMSKADTERLLSRVRKKLVRRLEEKEMTLLEVAAIQLELEDEDLNVWREKWAEISKKPKAK